MLPLQGTLPTPLSMLQLVALVVVQVNVDSSGGLAPWSMVAGVALKAVMTGPNTHAAQFTVRPQLFVTVPQLPTQVWASASGVHLPLPLPLSCPLSCPLRLPFRLSLPSPERCLLRL